MEYSFLIGKKLKAMKNKDLHEKFTKLTESLIGSGQDVMLQDLYRVIDKYDSVTRENFGLKETNKNLNAQLYRKKIGYAGGFTTRKRRESSHN